MYNEFARQRDGPFDFEIRRPGHFKKVATVFETHLLERTGTDRHLQVRIGLVLKDLQEQLII